MNILEKITATKKQEVSHQKQVIPVSRLKKFPGFGRTCISMRDSLLKPGASGIIAEFKTKSPSRGVINKTAKVEEVTKGYVEAGASGLSILTDFHYFGGTLENLTKAREFNPGIPILRKDFIIDSYQLLEAKACGADVVLLIAACLDNEQAELLAKKAKNLGMEVLMEIHNPEELLKVNNYIDMIGVNNRNLKTFEVSVETSINLARLIPERYLKISESGLADATTIRNLRESGFNGFLIGETFMKTSSPGETCKNFIDQL